MSSLRISYFGATDVGRVRNNNEDTFIINHGWDDDHFLFGVIDGMGGEEGGEVAADIAQKAIIERINNVDRSNPGSPLNVIKSAMAEANNAIIRQKELEPRYSRMGCVATCGIVDMRAKTLSVAHVGDSRLYRYAHDFLAKLSHDHSLVGYQEEQGILSEEAAMKHPRRSIIERCVGYDFHEPDDNHFIEAGIFPVSSGESFLFCSDGLSDVLTSKQISEIMALDISPEEKCKKLIDSANGAGGKDNITVVIVAFESDSLDNKDDIETQADIEAEDFPESEVDIETETDIEPEDNGEPAAEADFNDDEFSGQSLIEPDINEEPSPIDISPTDKIHEDSLVFFLGILLSMMVCTAIGYYMGATASHNSLENKSVEIVLEDHVVNLPTDSVEASVNDIVKDSIANDHELNQLPSNHE